MSTLSASAATSLLRADPGATVVGADFDGTLGEIVADPTAARPVPGAVDVLRALNRRFRRVAIISGRPLEFLRSVLPRELWLAGLYGLEIANRGHRREHPNAGAWREAVRDVVAATDAHGPDGLDVEAKGLSLTLHYRSHPDLADAAQEWAQRQARRSGLSARPARMSWELHPPVAISKGSALLDAVGDARAACFVGDDLGDLEAFDALDDLEAEGRSVVRVGVRSAESPVELLDRADLVLDGPRSVVEWMEGLLDA